MVEDSGDVGVEEALRGEGGAEWEGEEVEEGSEQEKKLWWSHTDMKVCFYRLQLAFRLWDSKEFCFYFLTSHQ